MKSMTGGELLARALAEAGVTEAFVLHGGHLDTFLVACADHGIRLTDTRHEAAAGHAADGYARAGAPLGVCVVTAGPGFTNVLTAIANAYLDGTPTLFIAGAAPLRESETNSLQGGFDQVAMAEPVTKWAHRITHVERIPELVRQAVRIAASGRPGPVFLEIPIDVMFRPADPRTATWMGPTFLDERPAPPAAFVEKTLDLLSRAERPVLIAGGGVCLSPGASAELDAFARRTGVPVVLNYRALGALRSDHPQAVGGADAIAAATRQGSAPDLVILMGARRGMFLGGRGTHIIPPDADLIHVDLEPRELGRMGSSSLCAAADCGQTLRLLGEAASERSWIDRSAWVATLREARAKVQLPWSDAPPIGPTGLLHPYHAARAVAEALPADAVMALDGGESPAWFSGMLNPQTPNAYMGTGYLGCLGVALGFAIGAQRAYPQRPVVAITGDGGLGFNIQEFDTMVRHGLPILTVVMNNACWGMSQSGQDLVFGANRRAAVELRSSNYDEVCTALGGYGERVERLEEIGPAVGRALASGRPACLNLITDGAIAHPVTAAMVGDLSEPGVIAIPYYENMPAAG